MNYPRTIGYLAIIIFIIQILPFAQIFETALIGLACGILITLAFTMTAQVRAFENRKPTQAQPRPQTKPEQKEPEQQVEQPQTEPQNADETTDHSDPDLNVPETVAIRIEDN
jgi:hemolysin activation/secretion protein